MTAKYLLVISILNVLNVSSGLTVATYNIWNEMFNWEMRKTRIVEMIKDSQVDVIALQEVRGSERLTTDNQLEELRTLLPREYKWSYYKMATNVTLLADMIDDPRGQEGIGVISRCEIVDKTVTSLHPNTQNPDKNRRLAVSVRIRDAAGLIFDLVAVHLSYYRQQQCENIADVLNFVNKRDMKNVILLGDFNTYNDYEWPVRLVTDKLDHNNPCTRLINSKWPSMNKGLYKDAWISTNPEEKGLTFSNMPTPGLESRPDRIIVSSHLHVKSVRRLGDGSRYRQRYEGAIHWSRFVTVVQSAWLSYHGISGYPCRHDCGPHGSCICGICVAVGNENNCRLPNCEQCNEQTFKRGLVIFVIFLFFFVHLFHSILAILSVGSSSYGDVVYSILGFKCCLFNPKLCETQSKFSRKTNVLLRHCQKWLIFRLPPYWQLLLSIVLFICLYIYAKNVLVNVIDITYNILAEEFFPSDHLMVIADVS
ncbi:uncharacterized protein LOC127859717 isoform X1 [Dreissena polymorpha]|uniref:Endonuclease/exonuclease/phosphatase domain-containing protein n=1 Tax=Dreissena polymorpha TaxID=45954 RepID=A0A9D4NB94_DREPO|nr:uncharacterized protein LOC127859717 isoform X1 [Dreissena polymorpha]KAH3893227.1 hypothetical protein DPMN_017371 [Dreissena polymorpha]